MKISEIISILEEMAPLGYAEDFDNVGLIVGQADLEATGILVCHDALESVVNEAISCNCNLIVCFHPILFSGIKKWTGKNYVERAVMKAIKNDIAIYAVHTALDNHQEGVNKIFCNQLGLQNTSILIPKKQYIRKLITYTTPENAAIIRHSLFEAGAGSIGNYDQCSFNSSGFSTYRGNENSQPVVGQKGIVTTTDEVKIEVIFEKHLEQKIIKTLLQNHIYEEVAYEIYETQNVHQNIGLGMIGKLEKPMDGLAFLKMVKQLMGTEGIRYSGNTDKKVQKIAVLGGSGSFAISNAISAGADVFLTADLKYHQYYEAENKLILVDIGHFESERFTKNYIFDYLTKKIINFADLLPKGGIMLSKENTNPVKYL